MQRLSTRECLIFPVKKVAFAHSGRRRNGKGPGINHPGPEAQEAVIRKAYAKAGLDFSETGYFECHGTGTAVGDPVECVAVGNVFADGRTPDNPLLIGSVKTNLGHCEGASGLAAVIKAVLCLENACIPATIGVKRLNPNSRCNVPLADLNGKLTGMS